MAVRDALEYTPATPAAATCFLHLGLGRHPNVDDRHATDRPDREIEVPEGPRAEVFPSTLNNRGLGPPGRFDDKRG